MSTDERSERPPSARRPDFPVAGGEYPADIPAEQERAPSEDRELSVMELMNAPKRAGDQTRKTVIWLSLAFMVGFLAMTAAVISKDGLDVLSIGTAALVMVAIYGLIGALRYKGEDPMAKFDPPPRPKRHRRRKK